MFTFQHCSRQAYYCLLQQKLTRIITIVTIIITITLRSVLTRAELEALPLDNNLKEDVEKGKVIKINWQHP